MSPSLRQRKVSSLKKKDAMWIYRNPQGLQLLENELNERRKKRAARQNGFAKRTTDFKSIYQPHEQATISVAKRLHNDSKGKGQPDQQITEIPQSTRQLHQGYSRTKMENSKALRDEPKIQNAEITIESFQMAPSRKPITNKPRLSERADVPQRNMLSQAREKLLTVQQKNNTSFDRSVDKTDTNLVRKKGIVSSFISAFEGPASPPVLTSSLPNGNRNHTKAVSEQKPQTPVTSPLDCVHNSPSKPQKYRDMPENPEANNDSYFTMSPLSLSNGLPSRYYTSSPESILSIEKLENFRKISEPIQIADSESSINIYYPQLSPELSVNQDKFIFGTDKENANTSEELRPGIKKQVSFSEQLLTYIPEELDDSCSTVSSTCSSEIMTPVSSPAQLPIRTNFLSKSDKFGNEFSHAKKIVVTDRRTEDVQNKIAYSQSIKPQSSVVKRPSIVPQKLSSKLLDMFQQKASITDHVSTSPSHSVESKRELVHLTKTRPRKPASLKKPTYPAATAQPDWRNRATNKKYEFVA
ncbi:hypothetical protein BD560DRAFT_25201 [Blakeslea trispora]|nr:hypothetical protein BD560DRAFT_25201 [Blakeslea trispora]